jgi:hypothetical protein
MFGRHERETERPEYKTIRVVELFKVWKKKLSIWWSNLIISAVSILVLFTSAWLDGFQNWETGGGGEAGMDPAWSGRGGAMPALVPSCVGHVCRPPIKLLHYCKVLLDYWIVSVVHSSLIIMLLLKLLYLILSLIVFALSWKIAHPLHPRARGVHTPSHPSKSIPGGGGGNLLMFSSMA